MFWMCGGIGRASLALVAAAWLVLCLAPLAVMAQTGPKATFEWTPLNTAKFGVAPVDSTRASVEPYPAFAPVKHVNLLLELGRESEAKGTGVIMLQDPADPSRVDPASVVSFTLDLRTTGKPRIEVLSEKNELLVRKDVLHGMYDLARFSGQIGLRALLDESVRLAGSWDWAVYAWKPEYVELRLLKKGDATPFRVYVVPDAASRNMKKQVDEHLMAYYWLAASYSTKDRQDKETLQTLARRTLSTEVVRRFLISYGESP